MSRLFHTTHWSQVLDAAEGCESALARLCQDYWPPLFAFVLRRGYGVEDAKDLTQSFFASLLEKEWIADADRDRGRFRSFLLTALQRFLQKDWRDRCRMKRGSGVQPLSLEEDAIRAQVLAVAACPEESPERIFDRRWAATVLALAMERLQAEASASGKSTMLEVMKPFLLNHGERRGEAEVASRRLGMNPNAFNQAIRRLRQRYRDMIRAQISETVADSSLVEEEMSALLEALRPV